jgi:hypothetical protein
MIPDFESEAECVEYLGRLRYPSGFKCEECGNEAPPYRVSSRPHVLRCRECRSEVSLTAGTIMERSRLSVCDWFDAMRLFVESDEGLSVPALQRALGIRRYETAYQVLHRLRLAAAEIEPEPRGLLGEVLVAFADFFDGPVILAFDPRSDRLRLRDLAGDGIDDVEQFLAEFVAPDAVVVSDDVVVQEGARRGGWLVGEPSPKERSNLDGLLGEVEEWFSLPSQRSASKHIRPLLNEYMFRRRYGDDHAEAFDVLLENALLRAAPGASQIYSGRWKHPNPSDVRLSDDQRR